MSAWVDLSVVASALGITRDAARLRAVRSGWRLAPKEHARAPYHVDASSLPDDVLAALPEAVRPASADAAQDLAGDDVIAAWRQHVKASPLTAREATEQFCARLGVSRATLFRWQDAQSNGTRSRGRPQAQIDEAAWVYFLSLYLHQNQLTIRHCYRLTAEWAREKGVELPAYRTIARRVDQLRRTDFEMVVLAREGEKAWEDRCAEYAVRDWSVVGANDAWFSDHHEFDLTCMDEETGVIGRPWLTAWMDARSRLGLGWHVRMETPNTSTILAAFGHAATRYGLPASVYIDNGKDYKNDLLFDGRRGRRRDADPEKDEGQTRSLATQIDCRVHFAIPYNAKAKVIERWFRTVKDQFSRMWNTFCGGSMAERPERHTAEVKAGRMPTLVEVRREWSRWVATYNHTEHGGLSGRTPADVYAELLEQGHGRRRHVEPELLRTLLMRTTHAKKLTNRGITLFGERYHCGDVHRHIGERYYVRYEPEDMAQVYVFRASDDVHLFTAPMAAAVPALGAKEEDLKALQRRKRARKRAAEERLAALHEQAPSLEDVTRRRRAPKDKAPAATVHELVRPPVQPVADEERASHTPAAVAEVVTLAERRPVATRVADPRDWARYFPVEEAKS